MSRTAVAAATTLAAALCVGARAESAEPEASPEPAPAAVPPAAPTSAPQPPSKDKPPPKRQPRRAEPPPPAPATTDAAESDQDSVEEPNPEEGIPRPAAEDLRSGHWLLAVGGAILAPSSNLVPVADGFGSLTFGGGLRGAVGLGLSRHVVVQIDGGANWLTGSQVCDGCSALTVDVGAGLVYHLAQATAFDPWIGYGLAYRHSSSSWEDATDSASGIDVARISLGGDFYPAALFGFGPFIETHIGLHVEPDTLGYAGFLAGLRFSLDPLNAGTEIGTTETARR